MDWKTILFSALSIIVTGLATWAVTALQSWLNEKLKDKKYAGFVSAAFEAATNCVKSTYQTYVEALKGTDAWTKEAQTNALKTALNGIESQLSDEAKDYLGTNFGGLDTYLTGLIESVIYDLKK